MTPANASPLPNRDDPGWVPIAAALADQVRRARALLIALEGLHTQLHTREMPFEDEIWGMENIIKNIAVRATKLGESLRELRGHTPHTRTVAPTPIPTDQPYPQLRLLHAACVAHGWGGPHWYSDADLGGLGYLVTMDTPEGRRIEVGARVLEDAARAQVRTVLEESLPKPKPTPEPEHKPTPKPAPIGWGAAPQMRLLHDACAAHGWGGPRWRKDNVGSGYLVTVTTPDGQQIDAGSNRLEDAARIQVQTVLAGGMSHMRGYRAPKPKPEPAPAPTDREGTQMRLLQATCTAHGWRGPYWHRDDDLGGPGYAVAVVTPDGKRTAARSKLLEDAARQVRAALEGCLPEPEPQACTVLPETPHARELPSASDDVLNEVKVERVRQDLKWGGPTHDDTHGQTDWLDFIYVRTRDDTPAPYRKRMLQIAALAVAAIEAEDRKTANDITSKAAT